MGKIFYILGKSCTGKDTIYKQILEKNEFNLKNIVMYTTRPIRAEEIDGEEYHFVTENDFRVLKENGKIIEERSYHTMHGLWRYFTANDEQIQEVSENYLMIGVLQSYISTQAYFGEKQVIPIYIDLEDGVRLERALLREKKQIHPKYKELCRRYLADSEDFSEEEIQKAKITKRFMNNDLEQCIQEITEYIRNMI